ncbi:PTS sugar transporter subunit IIC, partial [Streptococcus suis]
MCVFIGWQRLLIAILVYFFSMIPITFAGTVAFLLNVFLIDIPNNIVWTGFSDAMQKEIDINVYVYFGKIGIMALLFDFTFV